MEQKYYDFETRGEAEKKLENLERLNPEWFCPLIKDMCLTDCVCYRKAIPYIYKNECSSKPYRVYGGYCDNAMFQFNGN